jgi:hypothetical protein
MRRIAACVVLAWALALTAPVGRAAEPAAAFSPGQTWTVKNSPAKIIVVRVEPWHDRTVVHVSIIDMPAPDDLKWLDHIGHMPFDRDALAASVDKLVASDAKPENGFEQGYANWQANQGGIFTISVPAAIDILFATVHRANPH